MRNRPRKSIKIEGLTIDLTSSLNKFFLCECGRKYEKKIVLVKHVASCSGIPVKYDCHWCNLTFKNRGNLVLHSKYIHGDERMDPPLTTKVPKSIRSYKDSESATKPKNFQCNACDSKYNAMWKLKYHIRGTHYNLLYGTPRSETQQVNQVWFEKVLNSANLVEIKKTGPNTLLMKGYPPDTRVKLSEHSTDKIDLHSVYPTGRKKVVDVPCSICKKNFKNRDLKKHIQEAHQKDFAKHKCNNCGMTFKRSYIYLKHVCNKSDGRFRSRRVDGVVQFGKRGITITNVSSLHPVEID